MGHTIAPAPRVTVAEAIDGAARQLSVVTDEARLEAQLVVAEALGVSRTGALARLCEPMTREQSAAVDAIVQRRIRREPLAYILGRREFYGIAIGCSPGVLIPRPESELLVEIALAEVRRRTDAPRIADVGTGSGAIAIAIAANALDASIVGIDSSAAAIGVARANAAAADVAGRIDFCLGDLLSGHGSFDIIVANLPYVSEEGWRDLPPEIRDNEPREALVGGASGCELNERIIEMAASHLAPAGLLALEFGEDAAGALEAKARRAFPTADLCIEKDLAGLDRVLTIRLSEAE